jgi:hypothetical protein
MASKQITAERTSVAVTTPDTALSWVHWTALGLAAVTGAIHVYLYTTEDWLPFLYAGAGFLAAIGLFFLLAGYRRPIYAVGVPFTVAQIVGYAMFPLGPLWLGVLDKAVQVALVVALVALFVTERRGSQEETPAGSADPS